MINYIAHYILFSLSMTTAASCLSSLQFKCNNGNCVSLSYKCDKYDDCGDNSDEFGCGKVGCDGGYGDGRSSLHHWMGDGFYISHTHLFVQVLATLTSSNVTMDCNVLMPHWHAIEYLIAVMEVMRLAAHVS